MAGLEVEEIIETDGEAVFSTYVTPNRPDLLSVIGVAREVSALLNVPLKPPKPAFEEADVEAHALARVDIESPVNCPRYSARVITGVRIVDSPEWMQKRLITAGLRPINNIVDATNYVLLELGQPLHAFDYDLLADHHIIVRQAEPGERIVTIDGEERLLDPDILVIADPQHAVAIAGVMGGSDTEISSITRNLLLESAHFNRLSIRRTARKLGMSTESSYRFERNVDPGLTVYALDRAAELIQAAGGEGAIARGVVDQDGLLANGVSDAQAVHDSGIGSGEVCDDYCRPVEG
jgi:phenylalanyl-tRNA synthetase beta chain